MCITDPCRGLFCLHPALLPGAGPFQWQSCKRANGFPGQRQRSQGYGCRLGGRGRAAGFSWVHGTQPAMCAVPLGLLPRPCLSPCGMMAPQAPACGLRGGGCCILGLSPPAALHMQAGDAKACPVSTCLSCWTGSVSRGIMSPWKDCM